MYNVNQIIKHLLTIGKNMQSIIPIKLINDTYEWTNVPTRIEITCLTIPMQWKLCKSNPLREKILYEQPFFPTMRMYFCSLRHFLKETPSNVN